MRSARGKGLKVFIGLAVTVSFLWLLMRGIDLDALGRAFAALSVPFVLLGLVFLTAGYAVRIVRWWCMLRVLEPNLSFRGCVWPFLTSIAVNNVLPFRAGDALRVLGFRRQLQSPVLRVLGTLVIERVLDLVVLAGFFFLGLFGLPDGVFPRKFVVAVMWLAGLGIAAILALMLFLPLIERLWSRLPEHRFLAGQNWAKAVGRHGAHLIEVLGLVRSAPRLLVLIGLSVVAWTCEGAVFVSVAAAVHADAPPMAPWFSLATGTIATLIPSSPGYIGTFDYFAAQGLEAYGTPPEVAATFALTVHAVLWAPLTGSGLLYLLLHGVGLRSIYEKKQSVR